MKPGRTGGLPAQPGATFGVARETPPLRLAVAVGLLSGAALAYEVLLLRLLAIAHWHHFAHLAIGVALLGFGASGTVLSLAPGLAAAARHRFALCALAFAVFAPLAFAIVEVLPFNALELRWSLAPAMWLLAMQAVLTVPFFFAGLGVGIALTRYRRRAAHVYAFDLLGAGAGAGGVIALLTVVSPWRAVEWLGLAACIAALLAMDRRWLGAAALALGAALLAGKPVSSRPIAASEFKPLAQALRTVGARLAHSRSSPRGWLAAVENERVPVRHAPGLSLVAAATPPAQIAVFRDGLSVGAVTRYDPAGSPPRYLLDTISALPYRLRSVNEVLVLQAGTGSSILQALAHGARAVTAVEDERPLVELLRGPYASFAGRVYGGSGARDGRTPAVDVVVESSRTYLASTEQSFELITVDAGVSGGALGSLDERYALTVEGLTAAFDRLGPRGLLTIGTGVEVPPRASARVFANALAVLEGAGIETPAAHVMWIRGFDASTIVLGRAPFDDSAIAAARKFSLARSFDLVWYPGMRASEANRFNVQRVPHFHEAARALLGPGRADYLARYKFDLTPTRDDRPYLYDTLKWRHLPELVQLRTRGGAGLLDLGPLVIAATVLQAAVLGALLIAIPLTVRRHGAHARLGAGAAARGLYFGAIGLGFMLIEIPLLQRMTLYLGHPAPAAALTLASILCFAGIGSAIAGRLAGAVPGRRWLAASCLAVSVVAIALHSNAPGLIASTLAWGDWAKVTGAALAIAPLALAMGMPFALGLLAAGPAAPGAVPLAWAVNGCASVLGASLATLSCMVLGIGATMLLGAVLYLCAAAAARTFRG